MTTSPLEKVYVILGNRDETQPQKLDDFLSSLFPYLNLTSHIYVVAPSLSEGMPQAERILKGIKAFLRDYRFVRYYLHLIHPVPQGKRDDLSHYLQYYYQPWRLGSDEFDMEAYQHQEIPRLGLLTVLSPHEEDDGVWVEGLLEMLKDTRLRPSLYLHGKTLALAEDKALEGRAEKIYYGAGPLDSPAHIAQDISSQDLFERSCIALHAGTFAMEAPCAPSLFITAVDGLAYPCVDAFVNGEALASIHESLDWKMVVERYQAARETKRDCKACRERIIRQFSEIPLPRGLQNEVAALLYYVGTMYQAFENLEQAIEYLEKSLPLAPNGATGTITLELATCYRDKGDRRKAIAMFEKALALDPSVKTARENLERLRRKA